MPTSGLCRVDVILPGFPSRRRIVARHNTRGFAKRPFSTDSGHSKIGAYHRCGANLIAGSVGFVAKYMGDGVPAYFGYPPGPRP